MQNNSIDIQNIEACPFCAKCNRKIFGEITKFNCGCSFCEQCLWEHLNIHLLYELQMADIGIPCCNPRCKMQNFEMRLLKGERAIQLKEKFLARNKIDQIRELHNLANNNQPAGILKEKLKWNIRICPNPKCLKPVVKDLYDDHVTCPYCKVEFCFRCSCLRSPLLEHGNHYHRKDCIYYSPWIDKYGREVFKDEIEKKCTECLRLGKLCERPKQSIREFYAENKALEYLGILEEDKEEEKLD